MASDVISASDGGCGRVGARHPNFLPRNRLTRERMIIRATHAAMLATVSVTNNRTRYGGSAFRLSTSRKSGRTFAASTPMHSRQACAGAVSVVGCQFLVLEGSAIC